jgi:hypothetical protein
MERCKKGGPGVITKPLSPKRQNINTTKMFPPPSRHHHHNTSQSSPVMDSFNIKTASVYINNLLLARGLLRDGKPIEFARPSKADGGKEATMAQIINLVHDLILKRDVRAV